MTRLVVESTHRMSSRPWVFITGRLEGGPLRIGDELAVRGGEIFVVRAVETHGAPGLTTVAVDDGSVVVGDVLELV